MFLDSYLLSLVVLDDVVLAKNVLKICSDDDVTASNQESISEMLLSSPFLRRSSSNDSNDLKTTSTDIVENSDDQVNLQSDAQKEHSEKEIETKESGNSDNDIEEKHSCLLLGLPHDITAESLIDFLDPYSQEILGHTRFHQFQYVENIPTILHSLLSVVIEFKSDWAKHSFVNTYNNLVFPVSDTLFAPIVVLPLVGEGIVFEEILGEYEQTFQNCDINLDEIHTYPIEMTVIPMPMCVQCLYRLKSASSGIYETTGSPPASPLGERKNRHSLTRRERRERNNVLEHTMRVDMTLSKKQCRSCMIISQYLKRGLDVERNEEMPENKGHIAIRDSTHTTAQQEHHSVVWQCSATRPRCDLAKNIWVCLTCSHTGCGRYTKQHAKTHFHQSGHPFSLELASGRIWDYFQDMFVHSEGQYGHFRGGHDYLGTQTYMAINAFHASDPREMDEDNVMGRNVHGKRLVTASDDGHSDDYLGQHYLGTAAGTGDDFYGHIYDNFTSYYPDSSTTRSNNPGHTAGHRELVRSKIQEDAGLMTNGTLLSPGIHEYDTYLLDSSIQYKLDVVKTEYDLLTRAQIEQMDMDMEKQLARETLRALDANFRQDDEDSLPSRSTDPGQSIIYSNQNRPSEEEERVLNRMVERDLEQIEATKIDISLFESQTQMKLQQVYEGEIILKKYKRQNEELIKRINDLKAQEIAIKERYAVLQSHIEHTRNEIQAHITYMTGSDSQSDKYGLSHVGNSRKQERQWMYHWKQQQQRQEREAIESQKEDQKEGTTAMEESNRKTLFQNIDQIRNRQGRDIYQMGANTADKDESKKQKSHKGKKVGKDGRKKRFY